ncbi:hypothetical protein MRX96_020114 [Rhipicephalus microplus]|uniref:Major facilitator superfamily (MFS) profile domain-containing protein n=1 Tax=Rhipicephalus microplus TaxID=6941 RepID=A0A9J6EWK7_RHIMP|nr:solute carrier family 22 member 7-like [Rhipicephalus microplus]KAH8038758.1 hypothetical protein HPB51_002902 [Rhipicephalus microplus]
MALFFPKRLAASDLLTSECFDCQEGFGDGVFQWRLLILCTIAIFLVNGQIVLIPAISSDVDHWCKRPAGSNISADAWKNVAIPVGADGRHSRCYVFENPGYSENDTLAVVKCYDWDYDKAQASTSLITAWSLVCDRRALLAVIMAAQQVGSVVFLLLSGTAADLLGRMPILLVMTTAAIVSTVAGCLATDYVMYTLAVFFVYGSVLACATCTVIVSFEVTVHEHRPLYIIFSATASFLLGDVWFAIIRVLKLSWQLKQAVFLSPTLVLLAAFVVVQESPRWLIAKGHLEEAEAVMMSAAEHNHFPLSGTACLMDKLRRDRWKYRNSAPASDHERLLLDARSVRRRALTMFTFLFSLMFSAFTDVISIMMRSDDNEDRSVWFMVVVLVGTLLSYMAMYMMVTRFALVKVLSVSSAVAGCTHCLLSFTASFYSVATVLLALSHGILAVAVGVSIAYIMEIVPTAVRGVALCWALACGSVGVGCACSTFVLQQLGREDVAFGTTALLLVVSLFVISDLPPPAGIECAVSDVAAKRHASFSSKASIDHMKKSLDSCPVGKISPMSFRSQRSLADGSLRTSSGHSDTHNF